MKASHYLNAFYLVVLAFTFTSVAKAYDCATLRADLANLPEAGGTIEIPAGTYDCDASIIINRSHVKLKGAGQNKVILRLADQVHAPLIVVGEPQIVMDNNGNYVTAHRVSDIQVTDLTLDGNRLNHDEKKECGEHICEGDPTGIRNNGITIRGASDILIENVTAHSMISGGLVTEKYCQHLKIKNFESYDNFFDGFAGYQTENSEITGLNSHNNLGAGISIDIDFNNNLIQDSELNDNRDVGIFARNLTGNHFLRVSIQRSGNHGVFMAQAEAPNSCARNNTFEDVQINNSKYAGIRLNNNCPGNKVIGASNLCGNLSGGISEETAGILSVAASVSCR